MRKLWWLAGLIAVGLVCGAASAQGPITGYCTLGAKQAAVQATNSTNYLQGIIRGCTVTVFFTGTTTQVPGSQVFSNATGSVLGNPFTANTATGQWLFYVSTSNLYDVVLSGGIAPNSYPSPVTLTGLQPGGVGGGGSGCPENTCVVNSPTATQVVTQPTGTVFGVNGDANVFRINGSSPLLSFQGRTTPNSVLTFADVAAILATSPNSITAANCADYHSSGGDSIATGAISGDGTLLCQKYWSIGPSTGILSGFPSGGGVAEISLNPANGNATFLGTDTAAIVNATTGFQVGGAAPSGHCLLGNGTDYVDSASCGGSGFTNPMTGVGDFIYGGTAGAATRLAAFTVAGTYNICETPTGSPAAPTWCNSPLTKAAVTSNFLTSYNATTGVYSAAQPAFSDISGTAASAQLPLATNSVKGAMEGDGSSITCTAGVCSAVSGGAGTVTSFSAGTLSPLFTTSVATATSTPALTFTLTAAAQNSVFAGPASGGAGAPSYQTAPTFSAANLTSVPACGTCVTLLATNPVTGTIPIGSTGGSISALYTSNFQLSTNSNTDILSTLDSGTPNGKPVLLPPCIYMGSYTLPCNGGTFLQMSANTLNAGAGIFVRDFYAEPTWNAGENGYGVANDVSNEHSIYMQDNASTMPSANGVQEPDSAAIYTESDNQNLHIAGKIVDFRGNGQTSVFSALCIGCVSTNSVSLPVLGAVTSGLLKSAATTGLVSNAVAGTDYQVPITLTTTGTSGAATFTSGTLNIPNYASGGVSSFTGDGALLNNSSSTGAVTATLTSATTHKFFGNNTGSTAAPSYESIGTSDWSPNSGVAFAGSVNVMTATLVPAATALSTYLWVSGTPNLANTTTTPTLNVNGLGAKTITKCGTTALVAGDYTTTAVAELMYDGTEFQLMNPQSVGCAGGGSVSSVSNSDGSLTISPTTGAVVASLNVGHSNTFTVPQTIAETSSAYGNGWGVANSGLTRCLTMFVDAGANTNLEAASSCSTTPGAVRPLIITASSISMVGALAVTGAITASGTITSNLGTAAITSATGGTGVTSVTCATATCTVSRGTYTVVGGTATTGTIITLLWPTTTTAWACSVDMNGGTGFLGIGHSVATATGMNITAGLTVVGVTFTVDYQCVP